MLEVAEIFPPPRVRPIVPSISYGPIKRGQCRILRPVVRPILAAI